MKSLLITTLAASALGSAAFAETNIEASIWGMGVMPSFVLGDTNDEAASNRCSTSTDSDYCSFSFGAGASISLYSVMDNGNAFYADALYEWHDETDNVDPQRVGDAEHYQLGAHYIVNSGVTPWGIFIVAADGRSNEEDLNSTTSEPYNQMWGAGFEKVLGDFALQAGWVGRFGDDKSGHEGVESMVFARGTTSYDIWQGAMNAGLAVGYGDFQDSSSEEYGTWVQIEAIYEQPFQNGRGSWFAGYQGDYVSVKESGGTDAALLSSFKFGITIPLGENSGASSPFTTPNFRAPFTNAAEMD